MKTALLTGLVGAIIGAAATFGSAVWIADGQAIVDYFRGAPAAGSPYYAASWNGSTAGWTAYRAGTIRARSTELLYTDHGPISWIEPPYYPSDHGVRDYVVEAEIRLIAGNDFGFLVRWGMRGSYEIGIHRSPQSWTLILYTHGPIVGEEHVIKTVDFVPRYAAGGDALYTIKVVKNTISIAIDGREYIHTDDYSRDTGDVDIWANHSTIAIKSFDIVNPPA